MPKYQAIAKYLRDQILRGDLRPGEEIPSERMIAAQFAVARPTATRALELLRREGVVVSVQGAGSYVADLAVHRRPRERYQRARARGRIYAPGEYAVISVAELVEPGPEHVTEVLGLPAADAVIRRRRVTHGADGPLEISTSWLDGRLGEVAPRLLTRERITEGTVVHVESLTGRRASYARDRFSARLATADEVVDLGLPGGLPTAVLTIEHVVCDEDDVPIEFAQAIYPPGRWTYERQYGIS